MLSYINLETKAKGQVETRSKNMLYLQALPKKERCMKVDKAPPEKIGSEKKLLTIEAHPPIHKILNYFRKKNAIESQDTNQYTTLFDIIRHVSEVVFG